MDRSKRRTAFLLVLPILVLLILYFYPKQRVVGGLRGGPIGPGENSYREDYTCIGIPYDFCPNWPDYGCDYLCFGFVTGRACSIEEYDTLEGLRRASTDCEGSLQYFWRLSDIVQAGKYFLIGEQ